MAPLGGCAVPGAVAEHGGDGGGEGRSGPPPRRVRHDGAPRSGDPKRRVAPDALDALLRDTPFIARLALFDGNGRTVYPRSGVPPRLDLTGPLADLARVLWGQGGELHRVHLRARQAFRAGTEVRLTGKEFDLLRYFVEHPGEILTRERLLDEVWGYERFPTTRTVDTHVLRLRQKFERDPERPEHILTVHGQGYRFAA